jgi:hypothetical protein
MNHPQLLSMEQINIKTSQHIILVTQSLSRIGRSMARELVKAIMKNGI